MDNRQETNQGTIRRYVTGYIFSLVLTITAYLFVQHHLNTHHQFPSDNAMLAILSILAISQLVVQLVCFLHLDRESKPRWNLTVLAFAAIVLLIIVFGSLWIMNNLNYRMTPSQVNQYLKNQDGGI